MIKVDVYNNLGKKIKKLDLPSNIFETKLNENLLHQITTAYQANRRIPCANTKTRGEVRGGGRKPWRQKGTGRARAGSSRSPIWRGGGVVFGPKSERNYQKKITKAVKHQAICMVLSGKLKDNQILILDKFTIDKPKTKEVSNITDNLPFEGTALIILPEKDNNFQRACRNIPYLKVLNFSLINALDLLRFNYLIILEKAIPFLEKAYGSNKNKGKQNVSKDNNK
jgi:large subunit ribosomal protein L4